jgi:hypothetical protein
LLVEEHPDLTTYPILSECMASTIQQRGDVHIESKNKKSKSTKRMERDKTLFCLPDSPDIFIQCSTALTPIQTPCFDLKTQMTPFLSHVIVCLVNDSLQNAKEKFEVKDLVRCWWKQTIVCHH